MLTIKPDTLLKNPYVTYYLRDAVGVIQFVGHCKFNQLLAIPDARKNPMFLEVFGNKDSMMMIEIVEFYDKKHEANNAVWDYLKSCEKRPFLNNLSSRIGYTKVTCLDTGEVFDSVSDAAQHAGVSQPFMTSHLKRNQNVQHVRGKVYDWYRVKRPTS